VRNPRQERASTTTWVIDPTSNSTGFFDEHPRFVETSQTGPWLERLNARYLALIHANREIIRGASVLDLASHDGRFTFAALDAGARRVVGIEHKAELIRTSYENMAHCGAPRDAYDFVEGDIFDHITEVERCDVVFCFGLLYHINDHMLLFSKIAEIEPRFLIIDTKLSKMDGAVVEIRSPLGGSPPTRGSQVEGHPTKAALEAMLWSFGWTFEYFDWRGSGMTELEHMNDYRAGSRVSLVVECNEEVYAPEVRERAVQRVFSLQESRRMQWLVIMDVAEQLGLSPQKLRVWVREAERAASRARLSGSRVPRPG